jgi:hypothetical protein
MLIFDYMYWRSVYIETEFSMNRLCGLPGHVHGLSPPARALDARPILETPNKTTSLQTRGTRGRHHRLQERIQVQFRATQRDDNAAPESARLCAGHTGCEKPATIIKLDPHYYMKGASV